MDRRQAAAQARFNDGVEWVRAGTIFAHDNRQYQRWLSKQKGKSLGLSGAALEQAVMHTRAVSGANVVDVKVSTAEMARRQAAVAATAFVPHPGTMAG